MGRGIVVRPCIVKGCSEHGSWGLHNRFACFAHRHLLEQKPTPPPAIEPKKPKDAPIGDLFGRRG